MNSTWIKGRHLQLILSKSEVLVFPAKPFIQHSISINFFSDCPDCSKSKCHWQPTELSWSHLLHLQVIIKIFLVLMHLPPNVWTITMAWLVHLRPLQMAQNAATCTIFKPPNKVTCHTAVQVFALAACGWSHQIQGSDTVLLSGQFNQFLPWTTSSSSTLPLPQGTLPVNST